MGWFFASCGKSQNEKPINNLIIQLSKYNSSGYQKVYSFIQFVRSRNIRTNISIIPLEDKNDLIIINYHTPNGQKMIFQGNHLDELIFDSLYNQMTSM